MEIHHASVPWFWELQREGRGFEEPKGAPRTLSKSSSDERDAARERNCARVERPSARQPTYESGQLTPSNDTDVHSQTAFSSRVTASSRPVCSPAFLSWHNPAPWTDHAAHTELRCASIESSTRYSLEDRGPSVSAGETPGWRQFMKHRGGRVSLSANCLKGERRAALGILSSRLALLFMVWCTFMSSSLNYYSTGIQVNFYNLV